MTKKPVQAGVFKHFAAQTLLLVTYGLPVVNVESNPVPDEAIGTPIRPHWSPDGAGDLYGQVFLTGSIGGHLKQDC